MSRYTEKQLDSLVQLVKTGGQPRMSRIKETTLLEYVIAYLQEESSHPDRYARLRARSVTDLKQNPEVIKELVESAIDVYLAGKPCAS